LAIGLGVALFDGTCAVANRCVSIIQPEMRSHLGRVLPFGENDLFFS